MATQEEREDDSQPRRKDELLLAVQSDILTILTRASDIKEILERIVEVIRLATGLDAVGIRLQEGDDYPFHTAKGYSAEFLLAENTLTLKYPGEGKGVCRDKDGNVSLECTCGLVLSGKTDPANPLFTPGGSAWTNDSLPILDVPPEQDPRLNPRNRCIHVGFRSIALIPLRAGDKIVGLIHLASRRTNCFTDKSIKFWEGIGVSIGIALLRKRAEESLSKSEKKYRQLVELAQEGIWVIDANSITTYVNPRMAEMLGYTTEEMTGRPIFAFTDEHGAEIARTELSRPQEIKEQHDFEFLRKDGQRIYASLGISSIKDEANNPIGTLAVVADITERKYSADILCAKENKISAILNTTTDWVYAIESNESIIFTSPSVLRITGYEQEEFLSDSGLLMRIIHPDDKDIVQKHTSESFSPAKVHDLNELEFRIIRKNGDVRWISHWCGPLIDGNNQLLGRRVSNRDITEHKRAEYLVNERLKELRAFYHLSEIVEREGITLECLYREFVKVLSNSWQYSDIACARIVIGGDEFRSENYRESAWAQSAPIRANREVIGSIDVRYLEERPNEDEGPFYKEERQLIDAIAERLGNIIERNLSGLELRNKTEEAIESAQKAEAYFDFLAHDIANILSPMIAYADMLKVRPNNPEQVIKFSSKILEQGQRASSLISNLRRLESIEKTHPNEIDTIDLRTLFSSLEDGIRSDFPKKDITISYGLQDVQSMNVKGGEWVENVFKCVYDNAVRYSTGSAVELEISASLLQQEGKEPCWQIEVSDHGHGIPDNVKSHFGESINVADREFKGVASSLPFCCSMIKCLGGELLVQDRIPGDHKQGTRIIIRLPKGE